MSIRPMDLYSNNSDRSGEVNRQDPVNLDTHGQEYLALKEETLRMARELQEQINSASSSEEIAKLQKQIKDMIDKG